MLGHPGENLFIIVPNKFMGDGGVYGRGEGGGAFCLVCIFHNLKMHVYLINLSLKHFLGPAHWELLARARALDNQVPIRIQVFCEL